MIINLKQRIVTAVIGLGVFFIVLFCFNTLIFDIAICAVALIAVHEMLLAARCTKNIPFCVTMLGVSLLPFFQVFYPENSTNGSFYIIIVCMLFALLIIASTIIAFGGKKNKLSIKQYLFAFFTSIALPWIFYTLLFIRNSFETYHGLYYLLLIFCCSWGADSGAYFTGKFFGKTKLAPKISPNKTVEGVYGGVASSVLFVFLISGIYYYLMQLMNTPVELNIWLLLFIGIFGSLAGVAGDLAASLIKRVCKIKDFGVIFPGHGGIMDRFDSVLFVTIFMLLVLTTLMLTAI